jgi:hypothetical protein
MHYVLLIYSNEAAYASMSQAEQAAIFQEYGALTEEMKQRKVHVSGAALQPISTATTVRVPNGKAVTTDGPFAETKEQLGGFYVVDVKDLDEAMAWAAKIPDARFGSVEVRPEMMFD